MLLKTFVFIANIFQGNKTKYQAASFSSSAKVLGRKMVRITLASCLYLCPQAHTEVRQSYDACVPLIEPWQSPASQWAMEGHFGSCPAGSDRCFVLAWMGNFFLSHIHLASVGLGVICFSIFPAPPPPPLLLGFVFWNKMPSPICYCSSSCGFVWSGRKKSSAQMVLCAPSICFDCVCVTNCLLPAGSFRWTKPV